MGYHQFYLIYIMQLLVNIIHHRGLNMLTFNELNRKNMAAAQKILVNYNISIFSLKLKKNNL